MVQRFDVSERFAAGAQYVAGRLGPGTSGRSHAVVDPATGAEVHRFELAGAADIDAAVGAARAALPGWAGATPAERSEAMHRWAARLATLTDEFVYAESLQCGKPLKLSAEFDIPGSFDNVAFFAGSARHLAGAAAAEYSGEHTSSVRREPLGVIGSIAPWNYPLQMAAWKILPAVAAGNTIVLKPSELTPLTSVMFAQQAAEEAGVPAGVINIVTGAGPDAGEALVAHPGVAMTSFTGSTAVGRRVAEIATTASRPAKRLHLELGGKAPFLVFDDADLAAAAHGAVAGALINSGQDCTAATRAYVQRPLYDAFVDAVAELMNGVRVGDPFAADTGPGSADLPCATRPGGRLRRPGPLLRHRRHRGGEAPGGELARGAYYRPTLLTDAPQDSEAVQQEIFGPVLVVLPFDTDDEGIALANDTPYGLAASAWSRSVFRTGRAARELQAGCVWLNDHIPIISEMPHGGYKASGYGKDMSAFSFEEYTQIKHVMAETTGTVRKDWHRTVFGDR
ncbi:aminobutyraldehyde dehydrogenase [Streptomyces sp. GKU 257-1]|nr:aminobutyraldehyde dehydrogenase [Streptomyces sp. GKU 257-1]